MSYDIVFTKQAVKEYQNILSSQLKDKVYRLLQTLRSDPFQPPFEKLVGDLEGAYSRRINIQHRSVYKIEEEKKHVVIICMWTHYGD